MALDAAKQKLLDLALAKIASAQQIFNDAEAAFNTIDAQVKDLQRQLDFHQKNGDAKNAAVVQGQLNIATGEQSKAALDEKTANTVLSTALTAYNNLKTTLLTPSEQADADAQLKEQQANYAQSSTKWYIYAAIGLVVVVIIVIAWNYFKRNKQAA